MGVAEIFFRLFWRKYARAAKYDDRRFDAHIREYEVELVELNRQAKRTELGSLEEYRVFHGEHLAAEFCTVRLLMHACQDATIGYDRVSLCVGRSRRFKLEMTRCCLRRQNDCDNTACLPRLLSRNGCNRSASDPETNNLFCRSRHRRLSCRMLHGQ